MGVEQALLRSARELRHHAPTPVEISIIVPTLNEVDNIDPLVDRVTQAMAQRCSDRHWELVFVDDDSTDGTWQRAEARSKADDRIRVVRRINRRGLSSAVLSGMAMAKGEVLVVMDADLQHDERRIPELVDGVEAGADVCIGSREADNGSYGDFATRRLYASRLAASLARRAVGVAATDPMSGFFAVSRSRYRQVSGRINPRGFKILLEFLARGPKPSVQEVGYVFGPRLHGSTKLSSRVVGAYLIGLGELAIAARTGRSVGRAGRSELGSVNAADR